VLWLASELAMDFSVTHRGLLFNSATYARALRCA